MGNPTPLRALSKQRARQSEVDIGPHVSSAGVALSENTERALRADLKIYTAWCGERGLAALPADAVTVARFVDAMAEERAPATVRRYVASVAAAHRALDGENPAYGPAVRDALHRMHRRRGRRQSQARGVTWELRESLLATPVRGLIDMRNRALLAVGYDTLLRRSELVAPEVRDLRRERDGSATVLVRRGKTDAEGRGAAVYLAPDSLALVAEWLTDSGVRAGRLFRSLRGGTLGNSLHASQIPRIYKAMAVRAGMSEDVVEGISGHSTRVGPVQDMIASGIELPAILQAGRWKSTAMVNRYGERLLARRSGAAQLARLQRRA